jgi:lysophospholipase L1-like esterase
MKKVTPWIILCLLCCACSTDKLEWTAIGDSITYLNEHADETGNRITKGYMTRVSEALPEIVYVNKGFNGWTAADVAGRIESLDVGKADVYSVFLGTNDWWRGNPVGTPVDYQNNTGNDTFYGSYRIIIDKLRVLNKEARIILIAPMQRGDFVYINDMKNNAYGSYKKKNGQSLEQFADAVVDIASTEKFEVVDLYHNSGMTLENMVKFKHLKDTVTSQYKNFRYPDYLKIPFDPEKDEYPYPPDATHMTYDGLHPSDEGYAIIAGMLTNILKD